MNTPSLRKLDDVLKIIIAIGHHAQQGAIDEKFRKKYPKDSVDIWDILEKLVDDRYIKKNNTYVEGHEGKEGFAYNYYKIRFEGLVFLEQGGYEGKVQKVNSDIALNKTIQLILAVVGSISAIYYISEALKTALGEQTLMSGVILAEIVSGYILFFKKRLIPLPLLIIGQFILALILISWALKVFV